MSKTKVCIGCGRELPLTPEFYRRNNRNKDGFQGRCRECKGTRFRKVSLLDGFKICTICEKELPFTAEFFNLDKRASRGLSSSCKECNNKRSRNFYRKNHEKIMAKAHESANKNRKKEYDKIYYATNKEYLYEETMKRVRKYQQTERGKAARKRQSHKRRGIEAGVLSTLTFDEWEECKAYFNNGCAYCGGSIAEITQDHVIPVIQGGYYVRSNIVAACKKCNCSKGTKDFAEWFRQQTFFSEARLKKILKWTRLKPDANVQQLSMF